MQDMKPTREVTLATAISAVIGLLAWIVAQSTGIEVPPEIVGALTTLVVGTLALIRRSAKQAAGAMAAAATAVLVWALGFADTEIPVAQAAYLDTLLLFIFAWITSEATSDSVS